VLRKDMTPPPVVESEEREGVRLDPVLFAPQVMV